MGERRRIWADLIHLGTRMWGSDGVCIEADEPKGPCSGFNEKLQCDDEVWRRVTDRLAQSGANVVFIDVGEGLRYPSHPELAAKGSWSPEKLSAEVRRLRKAGLSPVPKLNFSTCHDQWLGVYNRMVGTRKYYEVCRDVINDVCDVFEGADFFHIGMDEECMDQKRTFMGYGTFRVREYWCQDVRFYADLIEKRGKRACMWTSVWGDWPDVYERMIPKSIVQTPGYYGVLFDKEPDVLPSGQNNWFDKTRANTLSRLCEAGYDLIPTGSVCGDKAGVNQFRELVRWCERNLDGKRVLGYLQTSWQYLLPGAAGEDANLKAIAELEAARRETRAI